MTVNKVSGQTYTGLALRVVPRDLFGSRLFIETGVFCVLINNLGRNDYDQRRNKVSFRRYIGRDVR